MTTGSFDELAESVRLATDRWTKAVGRGDSASADVALADLFRALSAATVASVEAFARFSPFTDPGFVTADPPDFAEVAAAGLELDPEARISREIVEGQAIAAESHADNPIHREIAKALAPGVLAMRAVMRLEQEVIALRRELRGGPR